MLGGDGGGKAGEGGWENGVGPLRGKPLFCLPDGGLFSACPAGATAQPLAAMPPYGWGVPLAGKTTFSFAPQKKKRFWTPKKKRWTSGNDYGLRYNRTLVLCCYGIPRVKDFGVSFCFRRPGFERPVVPFAPLPLSGWNTVPRLLVSAPPGWVVFGRGGLMLPGWATLWMGCVSCG